MPAKKQTDNITEKRIAQYDKLIEKLEGIERKGATMPYTSLNGHMFSFLANDGALALRLPKDALQEFIAKYDAALHEAHGTVLKEYVTVPDELLGKAAVMNKWFAVSYDYVSSLKPKAPKKKG